MSTSQQIDNYIQHLHSWQRDYLVLFRRLIHEVEPNVIEEWKWTTPVYSHNGLVCATGAFSDHVKLNFFNGAAIPDVNNLFNAGLESKRTRAIDYREKDTINEIELKALLTIAFLHNSIKK